jgi:murein DD-endopeptidase MepM/ murein hydrolase activator NlpD
MRSSITRPTGHPPAGLVLCALVLLVALFGPDTAAATATTTPLSAGSYLPAPLVRFSWPLPPPHPLLRPFQPPATPYGPGHRGVDLGGWAGEAVAAAGDGLVLYAGPLADRSLVSVEHSDGLRTTYEPVNPTVRVGQQVRRGEVIGQLLPGHPGCPASTGPRQGPAPVCLHWGVHRGRQYLDPLRLVESGRIRLLPWPAGLD